MVDIDGIVDASLVALRQRCRDLEAENERLRHLAVEMCDVNDCGEESRYGFVVSIGDGLRYEISVCEEHFDWT